VGKTGLLFEHHCSPRKERDTSTGKREIAAASPPEAYRNQEGRLDAAETILSRHRTPKTAPAEKVEGNEREESKRTCPVYTTTTPTRETVTLSLFSRMILLE